MPRTCVSFLAGLTLGGALFAGGLLLGGMGRTEPDTLRVREIEIVDELGTTLMVIGGNRDGGSISLRNRFGRTVLLAAAAPEGGALIGNYSDTGRRAFEIGVAEHGPELGLTGRDRRGGMRMNFTEDGGASLACLGPDARPRVRFASDSRGRGVIETFREGESRLVSLGSTVHDQGHISTHGPEGQALIVLTSTLDSEGQLYTYNAAGIPLFALATHAGGPSLRVFNRHGESVVAIEAGEEDQGEIGLFRRDGGGRVLLP